MRKIEIYSCMCKQNEVFSSARRIYKLKNGLLLQKSMTQSVFFTFPTKTKKNLCKKTQSKYGDGSIFFVVELEKIVVIFFYSHLY